MGWASFWSTFIVTSALQREAFFIDMNEGHDNELSTEFISRSDLKGVSNARTDPLYRTVNEIKGKSAEVTSEVERVSRRIDGLAAVLRLQKNMIDVGHWMTLGDHVMMDTNANAVSRTLQIRTGKKCNDCLLSICTNH